MGITNVSWKSLQEILPDVSNKRIVELGDQEFVLPGNLQYDGFDLHFSKNYYDLLGAAHVAIDWHGKNGALAVDMSKPLPNLLCGKFDLLTNFGFAEHVEDQYQVWKNIHDLMKPDGWMIHELPGQAMFPGGHEIYPWFTIDFFENLSKKQNYQIINIRYHQHDFAPYIGRCVWAVLIKSDAEFMSLEEFQTLDLRRNNT